ncbi:hypothetical protein HB4184_10565 [Pseudomonas putida]|nr:hypothetical protein HB4184_10565 [Pseudomonas putida]
MSQVSSPSTPEIDGNPQLFQKVFGLACKKAGPGMPVEVVLCQLMYHTTEELLISDLPAGHIRGVVEIAVQSVAAEQAALRQQAGGVA